MGKVNLNPVTATSKASDINDRAFASEFMKGLVAAADILAAVKNQNPSKSESFLSEFKAQIEKLGIAALTKLKEIAQSAAKKLGLNSRAPAVGRQEGIPKGFLWKPVADNPPHGLAILTPPEWTGNVTKVTLLSPDGREVLASGRDGGVGNGDRQHFRFDSKGATFPDGTIVDVTFKDGSHRQLEVSDTSARVE